MKWKLLILILVIIAAAGTVYAVSRKKLPIGSIFPTVARPAISNTVITLHTSPDEGSAVAFIYPANSYIGDVDLSEQQNLENEGNYYWSPIIPIPMYDKGDNLYVLSSDVSLATRDPNTYNQLPSQNNYT